jgi:hypothetical protein
MVHVPVSLSEGLESITEAIIIFLFIRGSGVEPSSLLLRSFIGLLYQPWMIDGDDCGAISGMN